MLNNEQTITNNHLSWKLRGADVLGVGTGDWGHGDVIQWTNIHLGWELGRGWGFRGVDWGLETYTWRCYTMKKQPFRLGTGDWGLIHGDVIQWTNNHWDWEQGAGVLGLGTGELYVEMLNNEQTITNNHLSWELGGGWCFRGGDWGLGSWRCYPMNKHPFRLGTGEGLRF